MIKRELQSFSHALRGVITSCKSEPHMRFHVLAGFAVCLMAWWRQLNHLEWAILLVVIGMVLLAELSNTAIEMICNHVTPEYHDDIKRIKDVAAGTVLVTSIFAIVVGLLIFVPTF